MTAHRRAWILRAGVVLALATGTLGTLAAPAFADDPKVDITSMSSTTLNPGDTATLKFTLSNQSGAPESVSPTVTSSLSDVTLKINGTSCGTQCSFTDTINAGDSNSYTVTVVVAQNPAGVAAGQQKSGTITVQSGANSKTQSFTLNGARATQGPATVTQVSGVVKDSTTGQPVSAATVQLQDGAGATYKTSSNATGNYTFKSTALKPIAPGNMAVGAFKDGYTTISHPFDAQAGQSVTAPTLAMVPTTASANPLPSGTAAAVDPNASATDAGLAPAAANTASGNGGSSATSLLLIIAGALLVLLGVGAIILILVRRKENDADDEMDGDDPGPRRGPTPVPASRGAYRGAGADPTMVARNQGYGDPTMIRSGGMGPGMDAPTTMIPPAGPLDEYPDPYGAPPPRAPQPAGRGYGAPTGQFQNGGYDDYGQPQPTSGGGYDQPRRGGGSGTMYGGNNGYDDRATGGYSPPTQRQPSDPYASGGGGRAYGGGYDPPPPPEPPATQGYASQYGGGGGSTGGYEDYGQQGGGGGYEQPRRGGGYEDYGQQQGGYDQPRGGSYGGGGYDQQQQPPGGGNYGGYERGGYDEPPPARHGGGQPPAGNYPPDQRRSLDWLDD